MAGRFGKQGRPRRMNYLKGRLLERYRDLLRRMDVQGSGAGAGETADPFDAAAQALEQEVEFRVAEMRTRQALQIEGALKKMDQGTYGRCEDCGKRIPQARLRAMPFATLCVACQEKAENLARAEPEPIHPRWGDLRDPPRESRSIRTCLRA